VKLVIKAVISGYRKKTKKKHNAGSENRKPVSLRRRLSEEVDFTKVCQPMIRRRQAHGKA